MKQLCLTSAALAVFALTSFAQESAPAAAPANPISMSERGLFGLISGNVVAAAQKMPEENYAFKATPEVRSFGQLVGHIADSEFSFCSSAIGEPAPMKGIETSKTTKADLVASLKEAMAYCNKAYQGMTDAEGSKMTKLMGFNVAKMTLLSLNTAHTDEHYGNMVTYMRLKGIVPPSSEKQPSASTK